MLPCTKLCFPENLCFLITPQNKQDAAEHRFRPLLYRICSAARCTTETSHKPPCMAKNSMAQGFYGGNDSNET